MRTIAAVAAGILVGAAGLGGGRVLAALQDGSAGGAAPAAAAAPVGNPAFVDISQVFQANPRIKKLFEDLTKDAEALKASREQRKQEVNKKIQELDLATDPGTPEYDKARKTLQMALAEVDLDGKMGLDAISRRQVQGVGAAYKEVCAESERIARAKGFTCVFNIHTDPIVIEEKGQFATIDELQRQMAARTAVWARPELDITKEVIAALSK